MKVKPEATHLRDRDWVVRPEGQLGTAGFYPCAWTAIYVRADNAEQAISRARIIAYSDNRL